MKSFRRTHHKRYQCHQEFNNKVDQIFLKGTVVKHACAGLGMDSAQIAKPGGPRFCFIFHHDPLAKTFAE